MLKRLDKDVAVFIGERAAGHLFQYPVSPEHTTNRFVAHDAFADDLVIAEALYRFEQDTTATVRRVEASWAGLRTFAPDQRPVVGFDPLAEGFFWLAGQGGFGVQTAPALSAHASALLLGGTSPVAELVATLAPARLRP